MKNSAAKQKIIIACIFIAILNIGLFIGALRENNANIITENELEDKEVENIKVKSTPNGLNESELAQLKAKIEEDELSYGDNYQKFIHNAYTRKPDRIVYKQSNKNGFCIYEKNDKNYEHLLEVSEDRMTYSVMQDYNLYCFTPDSIDRMMSSGDNYIIFDYDNEGLTEYGSNFQKNLIFRFSENTRLYRLVSYLSCYKDLISREELGKEEFANDTSISGYRYMVYNGYSD